MRVTLRGNLELVVVRTFRTPRKQSAETKPLPFVGMSLSSAGSLRDMVRINFFGGNARHACVGYGPGCRVGSGGESSKLDGLVPPSEGGGRDEMTGMERVARDSSEHTHLQRLKRYVQPADGLRCLGVIAGKVGDDAPRCGGYQAGRVHLEREVVVL